MVQRFETDTLGTISLPENALYGIQTKRAIQNFALGTQTVHPDLIKYMIIVKQACIYTHNTLGTIDEIKCNYLLDAANILLEHFFPHHSNSSIHKKKYIPDPNALLILLEHMDFSEVFPTHCLQGGAGTSTNMNVNEVLANSALCIANLPLGSYHYIHPLDDVNKFQSTNDVYPTALRLAAIEKVRTLSQCLSKLQEAFQKKEIEFDAIPKMGRTQLMDALPITLGQEFGSYAQAIARDRWRIYKVEERLRQVNLGGTAVGNAAQTTKKYTYKVIDVLRDFTGFGIAKAEYPMDLTQNNDVFVEVSGLLKSCAVNLMKISNDVRLMNSGPKGGLGEIKLKPLQAGSSIMPGKVNPVIPEMVSQIAMQVMAYDSAISFAAASGQFELNAFMPFIAENLLSSLSLLISGVDIFRAKCIETVEADIEQCQKHLSHSTAFATALVPYLGYEMATKLYNQFQGNEAELKEYIQQENLLDADAFEALASFFQS